MIAFAIALLAGAFAAGAVWLFNYLSGGEWFLPRRLAETNGGENSNEVDMRISYGTVSNILRDVTVILSSIGLILLMVHFLNEVEHQEMMDRIQQETMFKEPK